MRKYAVLIACLLVIVVARSAVAHTDLVGAEPAPGAQLEESPAEIRLTFSESVAATSQIVLLSENFQPIEGLVPQFNPAQPEQIYTPLLVLEPGVYTVQWTAASEDGHEVSGSYSFSVGMGTPGEPSDASSETPVTQSSPLESGVTWWIGVLVVLAVGLPIALVVLRRSARH